MIKKMKILDDLNIILLILLYFEFLSRSHSHIITKKHNLSQNKNKIKTQKTFINIYKIYLYK
jgi:hypothetical protein